MGNNMEIRVKEQVELFFSPPLYVNYTCNIWPMQNYFVPLHP